MKMNYIYEEWRPVKGYEGLYEVSNFGRVKSLERDVKCKGNSKRTIKETILNPENGVKGYLRVYLYKDGKYIRKQVHRLVAEAFIPNPLNLPCINHKGETPSKNFVWQLEWCTIQYNNTYGNRIDKQKVKLFKPVLQFDLNGNFIKEYTSIKEVEIENGLNHSLISRCCLGKVKTAYKYIWKYKEKAV